jgi:orotidine-5'-phosphate decarboxylase
MGRANLRRVVERIPSGIGILAVTLLTSLGKEDLRDLPYRKELVENPSLLVEELARSAREAGCTGVVCSGQEVQRIKKRFGKDLIVVTPGIRPLWSAAPDDQKRVVTPSQAVSQGADYIVVGRPIRDAEDPAAAADRIAAEM